MKRALCAILFATLVSSSSQAGYDGEINLASGSGPNGSLERTLSGLGSVLVGTNLSAPIATTLAGSNAGATTTLGGYFDFNTGAYSGTDASGNVHYAAGGDFFVLTGTLPNASGTPPLASSLTAGAATVSSLGMKTPGGDAEYELTMGFTGAYLSQTVATAFGLPYVSLPEGRIYSGSLDFIFVVNPSMAGDQLLSGTIAFNAPIQPQSVPEPSSLAMLVIGGLGLVGYGRRRFQRRPW